MINNEDRKQLIKYRIEQAQESIKEANVLIENELYKGAVNRIYYGMFYIVLALALEKEFKTSKINN